MTSETEKTSRAAAEKSGWPSVVLVLLVCGLVARLILGRLGAQTEEEPLDLESPLALSSAQCRVSRSVAVARGREVEALADASWERLPFDLREAPLSVVRSAEAENCYRLAGDLEGSHRAALKRRTFEDDLHRRWKHSKLTLELARRAADPSAMRAQIAALLALSSQAGAEASAYRGRLETLDRAAEGALAEAKTKED